MLTTQLISQVPKSTKHLLVSMSLFKGTLFLGDANGNPIGDHFPDFLLGGVPHFETNMVKRPTHLPVGMANLCVFGEPPVCCKGLS